MSETLVHDCSQQSDKVVASTVIDRVLLRQLSPKDVKWDDRRAETDRVKDLYHGTIYDPLAGRMSDCSGRLGFGFEVGEDGVSKLKLHSARFCRVRHCPVCQWRRSLMWRAKAFKILPQVVEAYPKHRFIFLTLTIRNCEISQLKATLSQMNQAWGRLVKRAKWPADGWIRSIEVTRGKDNTAHPHFHCLLMVKASYFSHGYISQEAWTTLWEESLRINYRPIVHVQAVKPKNKGTLDTLEAVLETLKYSVKPADLIGDPKEPTEEDKAWLVELTSQLHKTRAVATGGILKEYLKALEEEPEDLIHIDDDHEPDNKIADIVFDWEKRLQKYAMNDRI